MFVISIYLFLFFYLYLWKYVLEFFFIFGMGGYSYLIGLEVGKIYWKGLQSIEYHLWWRGYFCFERISLAILWRIEGSFPKPGEFFFVIAEFGYIFLLMGGRWMLTVLGIDLLGDGFWWKLIFGFFLRECFCEGHLKMYLNLINYYFLIC
jgi:hypothetical protein